MTDQEATPAGGEGRGDDTRPEARRGRPRLDDEMVPRILDAAERLFASRSGLSVSIRDIAAEAGLPHSAIYRYFKSKDDVLHRVVVRGRQRQLERDARSRETGDTLEGAIDWLMTQNRAYVVSVVRALLDGASVSSLALDPAVSSAATTARLLEDHAGEFRARYGQDPRLVAAALTALGMGWAVAEEWLVETAGLQDRELADVRRELGALMGSMMALAASEPDE